MQLTQKKLELQQAFAEQEGFRHQGLQALQLVRSLLLHAALAKTLLLSCLTGCSLLSKQSNQHKTQSTEHGNLYSFCTAYVLLSQPICYCITA